MDAQVGALIHQRLWLRSISQRKVAEVIGVTQSSVSSRLRGKTPFSVGELFAVAELLGIDVASLLNLDPLAPVMETGERIEIGAKLPRLDSNQQPFGSLSEQVSGGVRLRIIPGPKIPAARPSGGKLAPVVELAAWREQVPA